MAQQMSKKALLSNLSVEYASKLLHGADRLTFQADDVILRTGEKAELFYVLLGGSVVVEMIRPAFSLLIQVLGPGEGFGWSALISGSDTMFQVRAREDCTVACIGRKALKTLCEAEPEFGVRFLFSVLHLVARRIHATEERLYEFCTHPSNETATGAPGATEPPSTARAHSG
jgi:CRP/FNR family transcriptional regulator, cyclic AMP receptor protein